MDNSLSKKENAIIACDKVINGIEDGTITVSSALLQCMKIARLVNDFKGQEWLGYEYGGYPHDKSGYIIKDAWNIAAEHGRSYQYTNKDGKRTERIFIELCGELESVIESGKNSIKNYTTEGYSVAGDFAVIATERMTARIAQSTSNTLQDIKTAERHLSILKSQYYEYAVRWSIELSFGHVAKSVFEEYQERIDQYYSSMPTTIIQKLSAIEELMESGNPEQYAQVLTSCRRLWSETAKRLFSEVLPDYTDKKYTTRGGKEIDVSGDHDNNKISAIVETMQTKAAKNTLVGSEIIYLVDWLEQINNRQSAGVHSEISREQAMQCIIHTYIALGDILSLKNEFQNSDLDIGDRHRSKVIK